MFKLSVIRLFSPLLLVVAVNVCHAAYTVTPDIDFGTVTIGTGLQPEVTITNTGANVIQLGGIASTNPVSAPFRVIDVGCANSFIQPGDQCSFMVLFEPTEEVTYADSFNIEIISDSASHVVSLTGQGGPVGVGESDILVSFSSIDFGEVDVLDAADSPYTYPPVPSFIPVILIENKGTLDLDISSMTVGGADAAEITVQGDCIGTIKPSISVDPENKSCGFLVEFKPLTVGDKNATITFASNDPDEAQFVIPVRATVLGENDGIPAAIEDAGPNGGDANFDITLDSKQSYVATLVDSGGNYVTYQVASGQRFNNMTVLQPGSVPDLPVAMASGVVDFTVDGVAPGSVIEIGVILPQHVKPGGFYLYGATADNTSPHWSSFDFDGTAGAIYWGLVPFENQSTGELFNRHVLSLYIEDGGHGDADMTVNGVITVTGAASAAPSSSDAGGLLGFWYLLGMFSMLLLHRGYLKSCNINI